MLFIVHHELYYSPFQPPDSYRLQISALAECIHGVVVVSMEKVQLYIYDLSMGMAVQLSPMFLGKPFCYNGC